MFVGKCLGLFKGNRLTPERSAKSSDLGARIHSVPCSSRRHGAQPESSSSSPSSASAAVTLAHEAQMPRFLTRSSNSPPSNSGTLPRDRQAMTASLRSTLRAWVSRRSSRDRPAFLLLKVSLTLARLDISLLKDLQN